MTKGILPLDIDSLVNATLSYIILSFCDIVFRYNQILMWDKDHPKTIFIMNEGVFYYKLMLFDLKNFEATYQRMMNKVFKDHIKMNLEVYVDDMLIKSRSLDDHLTTLEEYFMVMQNNKVRINLATYAFGVTIRKFLGFMLIERGIKVNPAKCKANLEMRNPIILQHCINSCLSLLRNVCHSMKC